MLRQLAIDDMDSAAVVLRMSFDEALPTLAGLHTPDEDRWFFRERMFSSCQLWILTGRNCLASLHSAKDGLINFTYCRCRRAEASARLCCRLRRANQVT
jgi:hypothetical protein